MEFTALLIRLLHYLFILFYVVAPLTNNDSLLLLHLMTGPLLWVHWYALSDECSLTLLECWCRGIPYDERQESFFFNLVNPIYKFESDASVRKLVWMVSIALWLVTLAKVVNDPGILTRTFRQAMYGPDMVPVTKVPNTALFSDLPSRGALVYTMPQSRFSSIVG